MVVKEEKASTWLEPQASFVQIIEIANNCNEVLNNLKSTKGFANVFIKKTEDDMIPPS
ncbi:conserved hypothetical protein [Ricinus communis]|uniref:Uncharacterized protein n=1 Tax=Ricinus communis TaxID=3988 RepID=B9SII0_RICCO|nr:conserved hypothetical protein [Ricinus communis]